MGEGKLGLEISVSRYLKESGHSFKIALHAPREE
jgi:hypothetical protein